MVKSQTESLEKILISALEQSTLTSVNHSTWEAVVPSEDEIICHWQVLFIVFQNKVVSFHLLAGSKDGCIRLWKCSADCKQLHPVYTIPVVSIARL